MRYCSTCRVPLKSKTHYMELITIDSGIVRNFCARCVSKIYSRLLLKSVKNRDEIELQVYCYNFLKHHKTRIES